MQVLPRLPASHADYLFNFGARAVAISPTGFVYTSSNPAGAACAWWCRHDDALRLAKAAQANGAVDAVARRARARASPPLPDGMELRIGDCRKVLADVPDNAVPLILTDPPYKNESEPLYHWLAEFAARVLVPGGSLICYTGHWSLNRDMRIFDAHLRYWWVLAMLHRQSKRLPGKFVIANHKPVLWYVKEFRRGRSLVPDVLQPLFDVSA